jgi:hypothetical protein
LIVKPSLRGLGLVVNYTIATNQGLFYKLIIGDWALTNYSFDGANNSSATDEEAIALLRNLLLNPPPEEVVVEKEIV